MPGKWPVRRRGPSVCRLHARPRIAAVIPVTSSCSKRCAHPRRLRSKKELVEWVGDDYDPEFFDAEFVDRMLMAIRL